MIVYNTPSGSTSGRWAYRHDCLCAAKVCHTDVRRCIGICYGGEGPFQEEVGRLDIPIADPLLVALLQHSQGGVQHLHTSCAAHCLAYKAVYALAVITSRKNSLFARGTPYLDMLEISKARDAVLPTFPHYLQQDGPTQYPDRCCAAWKMQPPTSYEMLQRLADPSSMAPEAPFKLPPEWPLPLPAPFVRTPYQPSANSSEQGSINLQLQNSGTLKINTPRSLKPQKLQMYLCCLCLLQVAPLAQQLLHVSTIAHLRQDAQRLLILQERLHHMDEFVMIGFFTAPHGPENPSLTPAYFRSPWYSLTTHVLLLLRDTREERMICERVLFKQ